MSLENEIKETIYDNIRKLYKKDQVNFVLFREGERDFPSKEELIDFESGLFIYYRLPSKEEEIEIGKEDIRREELRKIINSVTTLSKNVHDWFGKDLLTTYFFGKEEPLHSKYFLDYQFKCKCGFKMGQDLIVLSGELPFYNPKKVYKKFTSGEEDVAKMCKKIVNQAPNAINMLMDSKVGNEELKKTIRREVEYLKKRDEMIENLPDPKLRKIMKQIINEQKHYKKDKEDNELYWNGKRIIVKPKEDKFFD
jgi:hypothetical protein